MKEGITSRVGRIISGGFNALVDAMENHTPEVVMEQAVREIDDAIDEVRAELGREVANIHLAAKRLEEERERYEDLSSKIGVALAEAREDLAKAAVAKQLDIEAQIPVLEKSVSERTEKEKELEGLIQALQAKKREMLDELASFRKSRDQGNGTQHADANDSSAGGPNVTAKVDKAGSAFDRMLEKHTGLKSSAANEDCKLTSDLVELEDLARSNRIEERFAEVKAKLGK